MTLIDRVTAALDGATPGPWARHPEHPEAIVNLDTKMLVCTIPRGGIRSPEDEYNPDLIALAPEMAEFITGLRQQWGVEVTLCAPTTFIAQGLWLDYRDDADDHLTQTRRRYSTGECRLVSRWGSEPEVVE